MVPLFYPGADPSCARLSDLSGVEALLLLGAFVLVVWSVYRYENRS